MNPELSAKPIGFVMLRDHERAEFDTMSAAQKGYFLHWLRSNGNVPRNGRIYYDLTRDL